MLIRETIKGDFPVIYALLKAEDMTFEAFTPELFGKMLRRNKGLYFIAEENGRVVGSIFATHDGGYYAYIYKIVVQKDYRRSGIASRLLQHALSKLQNVPWIFAHVKKTNFASISLLRKLGFRERETHALVDIYKGSDG